MCAITRPVMNIDTGNIYCIKKKISFALKCIEIVLMYRKWVEFGFYQDNTEKVFMELMKCLLKYCGC